jgi:hypothetical protein
MLHLKMTAKDGAACQAAVTTVRASGTTCSATVKTMVESCILNTVSLKSIVLAFYFLYKIRPGGSVTSATATAH